VNGAAAFPGSGVKAAFSRRAPLSPARRERFCMSAWIAHIQGRIAHIQGQHTSRGSTHVGMVLAG